MLKFHNNNNNLDDNNKKTDNKPLTNTLFSCNEPCPNPEYIFKCSEAFNFPEELNDLVFVEHLYGGSGGVYVLEDSKARQKYTFKAHKDINHIKEEIVADFIYQSANVKLPYFSVISEAPLCLEGHSIPQNGIYRLAHYIEPNPHVEISTIKKVIARHFVIDAWLANWDITVNLGNIIVDKNNMLYRVDNGGALRFRANNGLKKNQYFDWCALGSDELDDMRNPDINPGGAHIYGDLSREQIKEQFESLMNQAQDIFSALERINRVLKIDNFDELSSFLATRLASLQHQLITPSHAFAQAFDKLPAQKNRTSASVLPVVIINAKPCVLLGKRSRHRWYGDFGGKSEDCDRFLSDTAGREASEETGRCLLFSRYTMGQSPSHDLMTLMSDQVINQWMHRMYICLHEYIPSDDILSTVLSATNTASQEFSHFQYVPIDALLTALNKLQEQDVSNNNKPIAELVFEEDTSTLSMNFICPEKEKNSTIILYPPIYHMLKQTAVQWSLNNVSNIDKPQRTRGICGQIFPDQVHPPRRQFLSGCTTIQKQLIKYVDKPSEKYNEYFIQSLSDIQTQLISRSIQHSMVTTQVVSQSKANDNQINVNYEPRDAKLNPALPTQTIADLQGVLNTNSRDTHALIDAFFKTGSIKYDLSEVVGDKAFLSHICNIIDDEKQHPDKAVLYHASNSNIAFYVELISSIRSLLVHQDVLSLRAFDHHFNKLFSIQDFIAQQMTAQNIKDPMDLNDHQANYADYAISCNFSLVRNSMSNGTSSIILYYYNAAISNNSRQSLHEAIGHLLKHLEIKDISSHDIMNIYDKIKNKSGVLYQIFIDSAALNQITYFSDSFGKYHDFNDAKLRWNESLNDEE